MIGVERSVTRPKHFTYIFTTSLFLVLQTSWLDEAGLPKVLMSKSEPGSLCKIDWVRGCVCVCDFKFEMLLLSFFFFSLL